MNEFISQMEQYPFWLAAGIAVAGYLIGSVSFARLVYFMITKSKNYGAFSEKLPFSDEKFDSTLISATWVTKKLGKKYGLITSLFDMLKVAAPVLLVKLLFPSQPFFLIAGMFGILGHNYPVYHKFRGGRGESAILGVLLVINWLGFFLMLGLSSILGYLLGSIMIMRFGCYILMIFWYWIYFNDPNYVVFMILANLMYWFSMRKDLIKFQEIKRKYEFTIKEEHISEFILMGKAPGRFLDKYGFPQVLKRKFKPI